MNSNTRFSGNHQQFANIVTQGQPPQVPQQQQTGQHQVHQQHGGNNLTNRGNQAVMPSQQQFQLMYTQMMQQNVQQQHHQQHPMSGVPQGQNPQVAAFIPSQGNPQNQGRGPQMTGQSPAGNHAHIHQNHRHPGPNQGMIPSNTTSGQGQSLPSNSSNMVQGTHQLYYVSQNPTPFVGSHMNHQSHYTHHAGNAVPAVSIQAAQVHSVNTYGQGNPYLQAHLQGQGVRPPYPLFQPTNFYGWPQQHPQMMQQPMPPNQPPPQQQGPPRSHPVPSPSPSSIQSTPPVIPHSEGAKGVPAGPVVVPTVPGQPSVSLPPLAPRKKTVALLQDPTTLEVVDLGKDTKTEGSLTSDKSSKPPSSSSSTPATGVTIPTFNASKPSEVPTEVETATPASETKTIPSAAVNFMKEVAQRASADDTQTSRSDSGDKIEKSELSVEGEKEPKGGNKPIDVLPADSSIASSDDKMTSSSSIEKDLKTVTAVTTDSSPRNIVPEEVRKAEEVSQKPTTSIPVVVVPPKQQSTPPAITAQVTDAKQQTPATTVASKDPSTLNNNNNKSSGKDSSKFNGDVSSPISSSNVKIVPPVKQTHTESGKTEKQDNKVSAAVKTAENNRLVYNRDELFRIKDLSTSKVKPSELTDDIINRMKGNLVMGSKSMSAAAADAFLPNFAGMRGLPGMTGASGASRSIRQSGNQPYSGRASQDMRNQPRKIIPSPSLSQDVKLHTTENAWKPEVGAKKPVSSEEETEEIVTKELLKRFRGYLNKITPQKYDVIEGKIRELEINTEDRLKRVLDLVFDKAVDEPAFCIQYATLCRYLGTVKVTKKNDNGEDVVVEFRRLLITRCQQEFEKNVYEGIDIEGRKAAIASCEDTDKKKVLEAELDEDKRRARKKSLGNMKLVGELYRLNMLKGFIMLNCVHKLCSEVEDETLECLCILLKTIGQKLETEMQANAAKKQTTNPTAAADLEQYFKRMRTIVADKSSSVSARVRFLLQDIIDMRDNNWQERAIHKDNKPKTIDQIHEDVKQEDKQNYEDHLRHQSQMKNDRGKPGQYNSRRSQQGSMQSRGNQAQETKNIISILQAQKAVGTSDSPAETTLAPKSFGTWAAGAKSAAPTLPAVASRPSQEGQRNSMGGRDAGRGQSYTGGMSRSQGPSSYSVRPDAQRTYIHSQPPKSNTPPFANQRQDLNRSRNASLDKTGKGSAPSSRSSSQRIESPRSQGSSGGRSPAAVMAADISEEEASKQVKLVIERLVRKDGMGLDTLEKEVEKYFNESTIGMFFSNAINQALESSPSTRTSLGEAFSHLICKSSLGLTPDIFFKALDEVVEYADDVKVDVPKFWEYLAVLNANLFLELKPDHRSNLIKSALKAVLKKKDADDFVASLLKTCASLQNPGSSYDAWCSTGFSWTDVLSTDLETFSKDRDLPFLINSTRNSPVNTSDLRRELESSFSKLLSEGKTSEEMSALIQSKIGSDEPPSADLISALTTAILNFCIDFESKELNNDRLTSWCAVLNEVIDKQEEREHHCLHAIQLVLEDLSHPPGLSNTILQLLYDEDTLGHDIILEWADDNNAKNSKGKALTILNAKRFLDWLREHEEDEEEEDQTTNEENNKN